MFVGHFGCVVFCSTFIVTMLKSCNLQCSVLITMWQFYRNVVKCFPSQDFFSDAAGCCYSMREILVKGQQIISAQIWPTQTPNVERWGVPQRQTLTRKYSCKIVNSLWKRKRKDLLLLSYNQKKLREEKE